MKVYLVHEAWTEGAYEPVEGIFSTYEKAKEYCKRLKEKRMLYSGSDIDEYEVDAEL